MLAAVIRRWMTGGYPSICIITGVTPRLLERHKQIHMAFWENPDDLQLGSQIFLLCFCVTGKSGSYHSVLTGV